MNSGDDNTRKTRISPVVIVVGLGGRYCRSKYV